MTDLETAKTLLQQGGYTCVLCRGEAVFHSHLRGVRPLVSWYRQGTRFAGFSAADKVVGKATAFLYILHGAQKVYAGVISRPALSLLESNGIVTEYGCLVEGIVNREGNGPCPFEDAVSDVFDKEEALKRILAKMQAMQIPLT